jgi:hypothetical protein
MLLFGACERPTIHEVRGILMAVEARDLVNAERVTLREQDGTTHVFLVSSEVAENPEHPNSASHLRQHMAAADPVIVRYQDSPAGPVATRILDTQP